MMEKAERKPANFWVRLLAINIDSLLFSFLPLFIFLPILAQSPSIAQLVYNVLLMLIVLLIPFVSLIILSYMTHYFGATPGKLLTGLRVTNLEGERLSLKRSIFRQSIGYAFSTIFFGIGFLSVLKDSERQAFHDKAVGSKVWKVSNLWPIGLLVLVGLIIFGVYSVVQTVNNVKNNSKLQTEIILMTGSFNELNTEELQKNQILPVLSVTPMPVI